MTYSNCKEVIVNRTFGTKEELLVKLDVFLLNNRIAQDQYNELTDLLNAA
ncbi:hypothetical protein [Psychrobacillus glaciei]|nr:hypothetical protein [Psychrobacillus glaciei]